VTSRLQEQLPDLVALAHDRSEGARLQLAGKLADLFLIENTILNAREEQLVNELIDELLKNQSPTVRHELVRRFADAARIPRKIAVSLAQDTIDIARIVLISNEALTDEDLITVVETQSRDHACAVAARRVVSEAVADALVTTGDIRVMQVVAENLGAKISPCAMNVLAEAARFAANLQKPILLRPELTTEGATRLYWWISKELRRVALQRFGISSGQLDTALAKAIEEKLNEHVLERFDDVAMEKVAAWLEDRNAYDARILTQLLRLGHFRLFNIMLGRLMRLDLSLIDSITDESGGRLLAVLCRSINIDKSTFVSLFLLSRGGRTGEHIVHPRELSQALAAFDRLSVHIAQEMVAGWRENPGYLLHRMEDSDALEA